jgi:hypothetical protein
MLMLQQTVHCWNYRRYVVKMCPDSSVDEELQFTTTKIQENFSNYSAWHQRSTLLPRKYKDDPTGFHAAIEAGTVMMRDLIFHQC